MIPARFVCWAVGHTFVRVHWSDTQDGWVFRRYTSYRCTRCGRIRVTIEAPS